MKKIGKFKDIYKFMPRFISDAEIVYENSIYLSPINRRFEWNHLEFGLVISPALINHEATGDKCYLPGKREKIVESALMELADPDNPNYYEKESAVVVRLDFLHEVVSDMSDDLQLSTGDVELALHVLSHANYELTRGASEFSFYPIEQLILAEKDGKIYYYVKLISLSPGTNTIFECLFVKKSLSELIIANV